MEGNMSPMFGKTVDEMLFMGDQLMIYFADGNTICIDFKHSSFKDPMSFIRWLEESPNESQEVAG